MSEITIQEIGSMRQRMLNSLELPIQLPEPKQRLDLESRSDSEERTFKHIHQSCLGVCAAGVFTKGDRCRCRVRRYVGNGMMSFERGHRGRQSC